MGKRACDSLSVAPFSRGQKNVTFYEENECRDDDWHDLNKWEIQ